MVDYTVKQGDCILSIAAQNNIPWSKIWNHPSNADLKQRRKGDPNVLLPGDVVSIPAKTQRRETRSTDQTHVFVIPTPLAKVRLRLLDARRQPRASVPYSATIDGADSSGTSDADGYILLTIPASARDLTLRVTNGRRNEEYVLPLGGIDPIDSGTGVQQRLCNLGYLCAVTGSLDDATAIALRAFQADAKLPLTGKVDSATRPRLQQMHGC